MRVDHAVDVRPRLVDLAVDEALEEHAAAAPVDRMESRSNSMMSSAVTRPGAIARAIRSGPDWPDGGR